MNTLVSEIVWTGGGAAPQKGLGRKRLKISDTRREEKKPPQLIAGRFVIVVRPADTDNLAVRCLLQSETDLTDLQ